MVATFASKLTGALLLLGAASAYSPHHGDEVDMVTSLNAGLQTPNATATLNMTLPLMPLSYFSYNHHASLLLAHIILMTVAWFFLLPISRSSVPTWSRYLS